MKRFAVITLLNIIFAAWMTQAAQLEQNGPPPGVVYRSTWGARSPKSSPHHLDENPAPCVIIHHSETDGCTSQATCETRVRSLQNLDMDRNHRHDISFHFLIGEDGHIYEGRGWGIRGAHAVGFDDKSIGICFIGNFTASEPQSAAVIAAKSLLKWGVETGGLTSDYLLMGHRQTRDTKCPGDKLYELIQTWPHWYNPPALE